MTSLPRHRLTDDEWQAAASGMSTPGTVRTLLRAQHSRHLLLATSLFDGAVHRSSSLQLALDVLAAAQRRQPSAVADLFRRSWFGLWVGAALDAHEESEVEARAGALAAVSAHMTGVDAQTTTAVTGGYVHLPGRGRISTEAPDGTVAGVEVLAGAMTVHLPDGPVAMPEDWTADAPRWEGLRILRAGDMAVTLDDMDPFRGRLGTPSIRLSAADHRRWAALFRHAWTLIESNLPEEAARLRAGVHVAAPLALEQERPGASVSSPQQCGAMALTEPADPAAFATTMIHEWAHSELDALMAFRPLHRGQPNVHRFFVAWRRDARPLDGVLHGLFAFLAVAEAWAALRSDAEWAETATAEFAVTREQLAVTLDVLGIPEDLTDGGIHFVGMARERLRALFDHPVGLEVERFARTTVAAARQDWLRRHQRLDR